MNDNEMICNILLNQLEWFEDKIKELEQRIDELELQNIETIRLTTELVRIIRRNKWK